MYSLQNRGYLINKELDNYWDFDKIQERGQSSGKKSYRHSVNNSHVCNKWNSEYWVYIVALLYYIKFLRIYGSIINSPLECVEV